MFLLTSHVLGSALENNAFVRKKKKDEFAVIH